MNIQYLGTAASEGIPALYCQCPLCRQARVLKGKDIRGRSGIVIDGELMLDFPPDIFFFSAQYDIDLAKIKHLLVTHSHTDHFAPANLVMRLPGCFCHITDGEPVIYVYGNREVERLTEEALRLEYNMPSVDFIRFTSVHAYKTIHLGHFTVTPLPAVHKPDEEALIYLVQKQGQTLLYAHDTGIFAQQVFDYLHDHKIILDAISLDCTFCSQSDGKNHMGLPDNLEAVERLRTNGSVGDDTKCIISHFSHNGRMNHTQLEAAAQEYGFIAAYDGMKIAL